MTWREEAKSLWMRLEACIDGGQQIQLIATELQSAYEKGIGDGINMEAGMKAQHDKKAS